MFSGTIQFVKDLNNMYISQWHCDKLGACLLTLLFNLIIMIIMAVLQAMTMGTLIAAWTWLIIITLELVYFITLIISHLWSKYRQEQQQIIDLLKQ